MVQSFIQYIAADRCAGRFFKQPAYMVGVIVEAFHKFNNLHRLLVVVINDPLQVLDYRLLEGAHVLLHVGL